VIVDGALLFEWLVESIRVAHFLDAVAAVGVIFQRKPVRSFFGLLVTIVFALDVGMRIAVSGWGDFKHLKLNLMDVTVTILIAVDIICVVLVLVFGEYSGYSESSESRQMLLYLFVGIFQVLRGLRLTRQVVQCPCIRGLRYAVSENKRRFVDFSEGLDLDLTYVTSRVIAMGLPTENFFLSLCRNPLMEVARFFDTKHTAKYIVINCCPELLYRFDAFQTGRVIGFDIQDHAPPTMTQFVRFIRICQPHMAQNPRNVFAVHCKAGKGRTGSLVVAWLLYSRVCGELQDAIHMYALARTDIAVRGRLQSVETPSQVRYLRQFEELLETQGAYVDRPLQPPAPSPSRLHTLCFRKVWVSKAPSSLRVAVHTIDANGGPATVAFWSEDFGPDIEDLMMGCVVDGDVRITVFDAKKLDAARAKARGGCAFSGDSVPGCEGGKHFIAGKEPGCLFFFLFHTAFMGDTGEFSVQIGSDEGHPGMDKAHKRVGKAGKLGTYHADGYLALRYGKESMIGGEWETVEDEDDSPMTRRSHGPDDSISFANSFMNRSGASSDS